VNAFDRHFSERVEGAQAGCSAAIKAIEHIRSRKNHRGIVENVEGVAFDEQARSSNRYFVLQRDVRAVNNIRAKCAACAEELRSGRGLIERVTRIRQNAFRIDIRAR